MYLRSLASLYGPRKDAKRTEKDFGVAADKKAHLKDDGATSSAATCTVTGDGSPGETGG